MLLTGFFRDNYTSHDKVLITYGLFTYGPWSLFLLFQLEVAVAQCAHHPLCAFYIAVGPLICHGTKSSE